MGSRGNRFMTISTFTTEEEFHAHRKKTVGSSDIPTLLGLNAQYGSTPYTLWLEKTGRKPGFEGNERTEWGHRLEPVILAKFVEGFTGIEESYRRYLESNYNIDGSFTYKKRRPEPEYETWDTFSFQTKTVAIHPEYDFAIAHADLWIPEIKRIQEAKSGSFFGGLRRDDPDKGYSRDNLTSNGIPLSVYVQTQWQMFCYDAETCGVSALIDTSNYMEYGPWKQEPKLIGKLIELADRFMWHVRNDKPPMPTTWEDYQDLFPRVNKLACVYPLEHKINDDLTLGDMLEVYHRLNSESTKIENKLKDIKKAVGILMGENQVLQTPEGQILVTMATVKKRTPKGVKEISKVDFDLVKKLYRDGLISVSRYKKPTFKKLEV